ncbi:MAG: hypothetical protein FWG40_11335 [Peptococcaceae bacterium]|nr:hypothetical protein [Peptococcaceae bacterium]
MDPRPNAPDQWDINLGKIAYMGQYLGDTISPYEMLAQMFGEPENLTKLQAMAKQWEAIRLLKPTIKQKFCVSNAESKGV